MSIFGGNKIFCDDKNCKMKSSKISCFMESAFESFIEICGQSFVQRRKWSRDRKWSPTANDPQIGPQMIPEPQMIPSADRKWPR